MSAAPIAQPDAELAGLADRLTAACAPLRLIRRVHVVRETASTQDAARRLAEGTHEGVAVFAGRQTSGRGRLGRSWADTAHLGLAMTFAVRSIDPALAALAAGLASCRACEELLPEPRAIGLRWPNDVVTREGDRKLSGVLIEREGPLLFIGIGINVHQTAADLDNLCAVSLAMLASRASREQVAATLLRCLDEALQLPAEDLAREWLLRECLINSRRTFEHDGRRITGVVTAVDPLARLLVRDDEGRLIPLPALTTSMVHNS